MAKIECRRIRLLTLRQRNLLPAESVKTKLCRTIERTPMVSTVSNIKPDHTPAASCCGLSNRCMTNRVNRKVVQRRQVASEFPLQREKKNTRSAGHTTSVSHAFPGPLVLLLSVRRKYMTPWPQISLDKLQILAASNRVQQSSGNPLRSLRVVRSTQLRAFNLVE